MKEHRVVVYSLTLKKAFTPHESDRGSNGAEVASIAAVPPRVHSAVAPSMVFLMQNSLMICSEQSLLYAMLHGFLAPRLRPLKSRYQTSV